VKIKSFIIILNINVSPLRYPGRKNVRVNLGYFVNNNKILLYGMY
jgi:hypothetical protein